MINIDIANVLVNTLIISIPLIIAATGGAFSVRAGIMALGLEGMMLAGAFTAVAGTYYTGSAFIGLLTGILGGALIGFLHGVLSIKYKVNQVISGIGLNLFTIAGTTLFMQAIWGSRGNSNPVDQLPKVELKFLTGIPILGDIFAKQSLMTYLMLIIMVVSWVVLFKTVFGLRLRMVGENPKAASTLGIKVNRYKYSGVIICGSLAGLAGSYLSIDYLNSFIRDMVAGRGYISVVINILGGYNPFRIFFSGLLFGGAEALQITIQGSGIPTQFIQMIPYFVTLFVLAFGVKHIKAPAGMGKNADD